MAARTGVRRVTFEFTLDAHARLKSHAEARGTSLQDLVSTELAPLLEGAAAPFWTNLRLRLIDSRLDELRTRATSLDAHIERCARHAAHLETSEAPTWARALNAEDHRALTTERERVTSEISQATKEANNIRATFGLPMIAPALAIFIPLRLNVWTVSVLLVAAAIIILSLRKRAGSPRTFRELRARAGEARKRFDDAYDRVFHDAPAPPVKPELVERGPDAGAPKPDTSLTPPAGYREDEIMKRFWEGKDFLADRIQRFLDQDDGVDVMRQFCEESDFEIVGEDGTIDETERLHLLPCTTDQLSRVPVQLLAELKSRRNKPIVLLLDKAPDDARRPAPTTTSASTTSAPPSVPAAPGAAAAPAKRGRGRPPKPKLFEPMPSKGAPATNGNGNGHAPNGGAATNGGGAQ